MRRSLHLIISSAIGCAVACDAPAPPLEPATIADAPEWHLSSRPRFSIGVAEGDDRYMFRRITGIVRTTQNQYVVSDDDPRLTLFDSAGRFVKQMGRRGTGPGEYQFLTRPPFRYRGDSIAVWDRGLLRVSLFASDGTFGRSATVVVQRQHWRAGTMPSQTCCRVPHAFSDGSFVLEFPAEIPVTPGPPRHASVTLARVSLDGAASDTIGTYEDRHYTYDASAPSRIREYHMSMPFMYSVVGDTVIGGNGEGQWLVRKVRGQPLDTIHLHGMQVSLTDSIRNAYAQAYQHEFARNPTFFEGRLEDSYSGAFADHVPAYTQVAADEAGRVWLAQWRMPFSNDALPFHIYSSRGKPVARITLPARTWIMHLGANDVALVVPDADGVQYVRVYDIIR